MEGEDINDSNCINFQNINKIRDHSRLINGENLASLKGVRVGLVEEFDIEELDMRNRAMQSCQNFEGPWCRNSDSIYAFSQIRITFLLYISSF
jgi:hypothetical protein